MEPILNFAQLTAHLKKLNHRKRIAVVCANDPNTEYAISRALEEGIAEFLWFSFLRWAVSWAKFRIGSITLDF